MSQSVGFEWGFRPSVCNENSDVSGRNRNSQRSGGIANGMASSSSASSGNGVAHGQLHSSLHGNTGVSINRISKPRGKRRYTEEDVQGSVAVTPAAPAAAAGAGAGAPASGYRVSKRKPAYRNFIQGQPLPFPRSVELMDKQLLQSVLLSLVREHPEIQHALLSKVQSLSFNMEQYMTILEEKLRKVYEDIPYSKYNQNSDGSLNDYAFGRMKASIMEFLNCIIDYLLSSIPPQSDNVVQSLRFLKCCTELLNQLPEFETASNNYYKNMCFEQISEIWCSCIQFASTDLSFMSVISNLEEWETELRTLNHRSNDKLQKPLQLIASIKNSGALVGQNGHSLSQSQPSTMGFLNISS